MNEGYGRMHRVDKIETKGEGKTGNLERGELGEEGWGWLTG